MMSFSYRAKLSKKLNKCTYRPIWSEFCADPFLWGLQGGTPAELENFG